VRIPDLQSSGVYKVGRCRVVPSGGVRVVMHALVGIRFLETLYHPGGSVPVDDREGLVGHFGPMSAADLGCVDIGSETVVTPS
jgi:hypothetical protein